MKGSIFLVMNFGFPSAFVLRVVKSVAQCQISPRPDSPSSILHPRSSVLWLWLRSLGEKIELVIY